MLEGIDVASYQGYIHWDEVRRTGKSFAICKASEGLQYQDPTFTHNWVSTAYRGFIRGSYHFLRPGIDGAAQADFHHAYVRSQGGFKIGDFCMVDCEVKDGRSFVNVIQCAEAFVSRMIATTQAGIFFY